MTTIVTRAGKGTPLTHLEVDTNFTNLNTDKAEVNNPTFTGVVNLAAGTAAAPSLRFGDAGTGFYRSGANEIAISANGVNRVVVSTTAVSSTLAVDHPLGAAATPSITFTGDLNTGLYSSGADQVSVATGGTERLRIDSTGQIEAVSLGTAAAPAYTWTGDPNTGIYSPGADQVAISTNGTGWLFVDSSGRVGVGESSLTRNLTVKNGSSIVAASLISNPANIAYLLFGDTDADAQGRVQYDNSADALQLYSNSNERLRLTSTGTLNFVGAGTAGSTQAVSFNGSAPVNSLVIDSSGRLGLGTSSPSQELTVIGNIGLGATNAGIGRTIQFAGAGGCTHAINFGEAGTNNYFSINYDGSPTAPNNLLQIRSEGTNLVTFTQAGRLGIGVTVPEQLLHLGGNNGIRFGNAGATPKADIAYTAAGDEFLDIKIQGTTTGYGNIRFSTGPTPSERARIDSSGRLLVGTSTARANYFNSTFTSTLQIEGTGYSTSTASITCNNTSSSIFPIFTLAKSNGASIGSNTLVANGDVIGLVTFQGNDGAEFVEAATIKAEVDGTPGANDMPGRLVFSTTADGASSPTERMRIDSAGQVRIASLGTAAAPAIVVGADVNSGIYSPGADQVAISTNGTGRLFIDASGNVGIGLSSPESFGRLACVGDSTASVVIRRSAAGTTASPAETHLIGLGGTSSGTYAGIYALNTYQNTNASWLTFKTEPAAGGLVERMRIDSSGRVGIGTQAPNFALQCNADFASTNTVERVAGFYRTSSGTAGAGIGAEISLGAEMSSGALNSACTIRGILSAAANLGEMVLTTGDSSGNQQERVRIDSSGRLLVGTSSARGNLYGAAAFSALFQAEGAANDSGQRSIAFTYNNSNAASPIIALSKTRGTTAGSNTIVQSGDELGMISFQGADGSNLVVGARIIAEVDGTPGANDMPGRLVFSTTADGASSPTERMRITSTGQVRLAGAGITFNGDTAAANELDDYEEGTWTPVFTLGGSVTYTTQQGRYTKVGRLVTISVRIVINTVSSPTGSLELNLPFTPAIANEQCVCEANGWVSTVNMITARTATTNLRLYDVDSSNLAQNPGDKLANGCSLGFVLSYTT